MFEGRRTRPAALSVDDAMVMMVVLLQIDRN